MGTDRARRWLNAINERTPVEVVAFTFVQIPLGKGLIHLQTDLSVSPNVHNLNDCKTGTSNINKD